MSYKANKSASRIVASLSSRTINKSNYDPRARIGEKNKVGFHTTDALYAQEREREGKDEDNR